MPDVRSKTIRQMQWFATGFGTNAAADYMTNPETLHGTTHPGSVSGSVPTDLGAEAALEGAGTLIGFGGYTTYNGVMSARLMDRMWVSGDIIASAGVATTIGSLTLPARDLNGSTDGEGCFAFLLAPQATLGGTFTLSYTNSAGASGRTSSAISAPAASGAQIFPLQAGDTGVRSIETATSSAGVASPGYQLAIYRPLTAYAGFVAGVATPAAAPSRFGYPQAVRLQSGTVLMPVIRPAGGSGRFANFYAHIAMD